jgi:hypothetical protein
LELLATGTISSGESNGIAHTTGPKISSQTTLISGFVLVRTVGCGGAGDGALEIRVGVDDVGRLAAELERDLLQVPRRSLDDQLADLRRAREGAEQAGAPRPRAARGRC